MAAGVGEKVSLYGKRNRQGLRIRSFPFLPMLKNFQRYFRFYLATFLCGLLLIGIRWQAAPLGEMQRPDHDKSVDNQSGKPERATAGELAML